MSNAPWREGFREGIWQGFQVLCLAVVFAGAVLFRAHEVREAEWLVALLVAGSACSRACGSRPQCSSSP
jgi:hypothetical protein